MPNQIFVSSVSENLNKVKLQFHVCSYTEVIGGKGKKEAWPSVAYFQEFVSATHFGHILFLYEPQGIRTGKYVSKDIYQSKFF